METIRVGKWTIEVDSEATRKVQLARLSGKPETCDCQDCRNFIRARDFAYPDAARSFLASLGIPFDRESEIGLAMGELDSKIFGYSGFFHFIGSIIETPPEWQSKEPGHVVHHEKIAGDFAIAFLAPHGLVPKEFPSDVPLVHLDFITLVPWVLDERYSGGLPLNPWAEFGLFARLKRWCKAIRSLYW